MRPVPSLALIPLMIIWFGIGKTSKIITLFLVALLIMVAAKFQLTDTVTAGIILIGFLIDIWHSPTRKLVGVLEGQTLKAFKTSPTGAYFC